MPRERPKDRSLSSCRAEAAEVQAQYVVSGASEAGGGSGFRRPTQAGALRYSVHPAWPIHFRQF